MTRIALDAKEVAAALLAATPPAPAVQARKGSLQGLAAPTPAPGPPAPATSIEGDS